MDSEYRRHKLRTTTNTLSCRAGLHSEGGRTNTFGSPVGGMAIQVAVHRGMFFRKIASHGASRFPGKVEMKVPRAEGSAPQVSPGWSLRGTTGLLHSNEWGTWRDVGTGAYMMRYQSRVYREMPKVRRQGPSDGMRQVPLKWATRADVDQGKCPTAHGKRQKVL